MEFDASLMSSIGFSEETINFLLRLEKELNLTKLHVEQNRQFSKENFWIDFEDYQYTVEVHSDLYEIFEHYKDIDNNVSSIYKFIKNKEKELFTTLKQLIKN